MKKLVLVLLCSLFTVAAQSQQAQWIRNIQGSVLNAQIGGNAGDHGPIIWDMHYDLAGNTLVTGVYKDTLQIGTTALLAPTTAITHFVAKLAPNGLPVWAINLPVEPFSVKTDQSGNIYLLGNYTGTVDFGGTTLTSSSGGTVLDGFLARYTSSGTLAWALSTTGTETTFSTFEIDRQDNLIVGGTHNNSNLFGHSLTGTGQFLAKLTTSGAVQWAQTGIQFSSWGNLLNNKNSMDTDAAGNIYFTFYHGPLGQAPTPPLSICGNTQPPAGMAQMGGICKFDPAGNCSWVKFLKNQGIMSSMGVDDNGNVYLMDSFDQDSLDLGSMVLVNSPAGPFGQEGYFLAKLTTAGQAIWAQEVGTGVDPFGGAYTSTVRVDAAGNPYVSVAFDDLGGGVQNAFIGPFQIPVGNNTLTKFSPNGVPVWVETIDRGGDKVVSLRDFEIDPAGNIYGAVVIANTFNFSNATTPQNVAIAGVTSVDPGWGSMVFRMGENTSTLTGKIFLDLNSNTQPDAGEPGYLNAGVQSLPGNYTAASNAQGTYYLYMPPGSYAVAPSPIPYYTISPANQPIAIPATGQFYTGLDFALQPIPNQQDLQITATTTTARPGFGHTITITYRNVGTTVMSGTVEAVFDPQLWYLNSMPAHSSQNSNSLSWSFSNLQLLESRTIKVYMEVPQSVALNTSLSSSITLQPLAGDLTPADNQATPVTTVTGSFDPNDKQVNTHWLSPADVAAGKYLDYTIRFQNTGNDTAFTVRLLDTLDTQLQIASLEVLSSSHNYTLLLRENNILEFAFDNILLPDSNTNEPASHGFIRYRIRPRTNLVIGDVIRNTAAIYFDFNDPVITNTTATEVSLLNSTFTTLEQKISVFPNPNNGSFTLALQNLQEPTVQVELRNVLGQIVWQQQLAVEDKKVQQAVHTQNLSKGIYQLLVHTAKGSVLQKVVVE